MKTSVEVKKKASRSFARRRKEPWGLFSPACREVDTFSDFRENVSYHENFLFGAFLRARLARPVRNSAPQFPDSNLPRKIQKLQYPPANCPPVVRNPPKIL